jgi:hypothetical protein
MFFSSLVFLFINNQERGEELRMSCSGEGIGKNNDQGEPGARQPLTFLHHWPMRLLISLFYFKVHCYGVWLKLSQVFL